MKYIDFLSEIFKQGNILKLKNKIITFTNFFYKIHIHIDSNILSKKKILMPSYNIETTFQKDTIFN